MIFINLCRFWHQKSKHVGMQLKQDGIIISKAIKLFLRFAIGTAFLSAVVDRE
jgi:hypothetical protein